MIIEIQMVLLYHSQIMPFSLFDSKAFPNFKRVLQVCGKNVIGTALDTLGTNLNQHLLTQ
jgi:hypothetical protein